MRRPYLAFVAAWFIAFPAAISIAAPAPQTPGAPAPAGDDVAATLRRQTQELLDAITNGTPAVWDHYFDAGAVVTAEDGSVNDKAKMVGDIHPLPAGVSGKLAIVEFAVRLHGDVAVANYVADERETYHGHALHCQYRMTDTWVKSADRWRLIASQVLALRTDPPAMTLPPQRLDDYVGKYSLAPDLVYEIRRKGDALERQRSGRDAEPLLVEAPDVLFVPGKPRYRMVFRRDAGGRVTGFAERREAWDLDWQRVP